MFREALAHFTRVELVIFALLLFLAVWIGILVWTFRRSRRRHYERMARLPLDGGKEE